MGSFLIAFLGLAMVWSETTSPDPQGILAEDVEPEPTSFFACQGRELENIGGGFLRNSVPQQDSHNRRLVDFLKVLQSRIAEKVKENIEVAQKIKTCFSNPHRSTSGGECERLKRSLDPARYGGVSPESAEHRASLAYQIRVARSQLAVAAARPNPTNYFSANSNLNTFGFKQEAWAPLSAGEIEAANSSLAQYKTQFKQLHGLSDTQFDQLLKPFDRRQVGEVYANPTQVSPEELRLQILQSELNHQMKTVRRQHLESYREIVSRFPIINYLSGANPSPQDMVRAAEALQKNAQKELERVEEWERRLPTEPGKQIGHGELQMLDYRLLVEELLFEDLKYCDVVEGAQKARDSRAVRNSLLVSAPILAACFFAPPVIAMGVAVAASGGYATTSYLQYRYERQGAYSAPLNEDGHLRSDQAMVDSARSQYRMDLATLPVEVVLSGGVSAAIRRLRPPANRKAIDGGN